MKKNDLYMISGTEYKEMTKEILAQSDLWAEIKKKADQKQKDADQMLIGIKPNLVSPTEASYGATTHPEIVAGIIEYLQERSCQHIVMLESSWVGDKTSESMEVCGYDRLVEKYNVPFWDMQLDESSISKYPAPMPTNPSSQSSWKPKEPFSTTVSVLPTWMTHRIWWSTQPPSTRTIRNMPLR